MALLCVLTGSRNIKFQALAIEDLIVIESRRGLIECNMFAWECFIVTSSALASPISSSIFKIVLYFFACSQHIFISFQQRVLNFGFVSRGSTATSISSMQNSYLWVSFFKIVKSIRGRHEYAIGFWSFLLCCSECTSWCGGFALNSKIVLALCLFLDFDQVSSICSWIWSILWV